MRLRDDAARVYLVMQSTYGFCFTLIVTVNLIYQAATVGLTAFQLVLVGSVLELVCVLCEVPTGALADLVGRRPAIVAGIALIGAGFTLEGLVPELGAILAGQRAVRRRRHADQRRRAGMADRRGRRVGRRRAVPGRCPARERRHAGGDPGRRADRAAHDHDADRARRSRPGCARGAARGGDAGDPAARRRRQGPCCRHARAGCGIAGRRPCDRPGATADDRSRRRGRVQRGRGQALDRPLPARRRNSGCRWVRAGRLARRAVRDPGGDLDRRARPAVGAHRAARGGRRARCAGVGLRGDVPEHSRCSPSAAGSASRRPAR